MPGSSSRRYFMREQYLVHISLFFSISIYTTLGTFEARSQKLICLCDNCLHSFKLQHQRAASCGPPVVFFPQMALSLQLVCVKWLPTSESGFSNILNRELSVTYMSEQSYTACNSENLLWAWKATSLLVYRALALFYTFGHSLDSLMLFWDLGTGGVFLPSLVNISPHVPELLVIWKIFV
jgi:hypothetical protein